MPETQTPNPNPNSLHLDVCKPHMELDIPLTPRIAPQTHPLISYDFDYMPVLLRGYPRSIGEIEYIAIDRRLRLILKLYCDEKEYIFKYGWGLVIHEVGLAINYVNLRVKKPYPEDVYKLFELLNMWLYINGEDRLRFNDREEKVEAFNIFLWAFLPRGEIRLLKYRDIFNKTTLNKLLGQLLDDELWETPRDVREAGYRRLMELWDPAFY